MASTFKKSKKSKINFLATRQHIGSTYCSGNDLSNDNTPGMCFGCPRFFFRFNFTSASPNLPHAYMDWCHFERSTATDINTSFHYGCYMGRLSYDEWTTGPTYNPSFCPYIPLQVLQPSRFVLAHRPHLEGPNIEVAFIALDGERIVGSNRRSTLDVGDNSTNYKCSAESNEQKDPSCSISPNMYRFLNLKLTK